MVNRKQWYEEDITKLGNSSIRMAKFAFFGGLLLLLAILFFGLFSPIAIVGAGERGVLTTWGAVEQFSLNEGLHFKIPVAQQIHNMDVKTQKYTATASSASKDLQDVTTEITLNFHIATNKAHKIFQEIGTDYSDKVIQPAVQESVKSVTARFDAEELITRRPIVKQEIEVALKDRLAFYSIVQETLSITDFSFSVEFDAAIESKVTAGQEALKAENILKRVKIEAQQKIAAAQGEAEARLTKAKAEAEALRIQREVIDEKLLKLRSIEKWNGILPIVTGGAVPFIDLESITSTPIEEEGV